MIFGDMVLSVFGNAVWHGLQTLWPRGNTPEQLYESALKAAKARFHQEYGDRYGKPNDAFFDFEITDMALFKACVAADQLDVDAVCELAVKVNRCTPPQAVGYFVGSLRAELEKVPYFALLFQTKEQFGRVLETDENVNAVRQQLRALFELVQEVKAALQTPQPSLRIDRPQQLDRKRLSSLLRAYNAFIRLIGRQPESEALNAFCDKEDAFAWKVLTGDGGVGKTRLALELALQREQAGWRSGFLDVDSLKRWVANDRFGDWCPTGDTLVVIDYAANKPEYLKPLLKRCGQWAEDNRAATRVRLLLLERQADPDNGWLRDLLSFGEGALRDEIREWMEPILEIRSPGKEDPDEVMRAIVRATFESWGRLPGKPPPPVPKLEEAELRELRRRTEGRPLFLQMAALRACNDNDTSRLGHSGQAELVKYTVERDREYIRKQCGPDQARAAMVERGAGLLTFTGPLAGNDPRWLRLLEQDARACGYPLIQPGEVSDTLAVVLGEIKSETASAIRPLGPDLLAEAFAVAVVGDRPGLAVQTLEAILDCVGGPAWSNLLRASVDLYAMDDLARPQCWLLNLIPRRPVTELVLLEDLIPQGSVALTQLAAVVAERLLRALPTTPESDTERGRLLNNLVTLYIHLGRRDEALRAALAATETYERLATANPGRFDLGLSTTLNNLGNIYGALGRLDDALTTTRRALEIRKRLAVQDPKAFEPYLATSLSNVGGRYVEMGRPEDGLDPLLQAVEIYGRLAQRKPEAFEKDLAASVINLSGAYAKLGRRDEALATAERAASIHERLARWNPDAFEPGMAKILTDLGNCYSQLGQRENALAAVERAVEIRERLAKRNPDAFEPDLAMSLNNLGNCLAELGRLDEAVDTAERAVTIHRQLAGQRLEPCDPMLAMSLHNLGNRYKDVGRREKALRAAEEAVQIYERLATRNPDAFVPNLAAALISLANHCSGVGLKEKALSVIQRSVELYEGLVERKAEAFEPELGGCLNVLSNCHAGLRRWEHALRAGERALEIYDRLVMRNPVAFEPDLALTLSNLAARYNDMGSGHEGLRAAKRAVEIRERLAERNPDVFEPELAASLNNLAVCCGRLGMPADGLRPVERALEIRERLAKCNRDAFEPDLAHSLNNMGKLYAQLGRLEEALAAAERTVQLYEELAERCAYAFGPDLAVSLDNLSICYSTLGRPEQALAAAERAVAIRGRLGGPEP